MDELELRINGITLKGSEVRVLNLRGKGGGMVANALMGKVGAQHGKEGSQ